MKAVLKGAHEAEQAAQEHMSQVEGEDREPRIMDLSEFFTQAEKEQNNKNLEREFALFRALSPEEKDSFLRTLPFQRGAHQGVLWRKELVKRLSED